MEICNCYKHSLAAERIVVKTIECHVRCGVTKVLGLCSSEQPCYLAEPQVQELNVGLPCHYHPLSRVATRTCDLEECEGQSQHVEFKLVKETRWKMESRAWENGVRNQGTRKFSTEKRQSCSE